MKFLDKLKVAKEATKLGLGGTTGKIKEIQEQDRKFKEEELKLLGKFEDLLEKNFREIKGTQSIILSKLNEIQQELK